MSPIRDISRPNSHTGRSRKRPDSADSSHDVSQSAQRRGRRALAGRLGLERDLLPVWLYVALIAAAAAVLLRGPAAELAVVDTGLDVPWWMLVPAFALAELLSVHLPFRREAHTITFGDVPLVAGLFLVSPAGLVGAQLLGAGVVLVGQQRQAPVKAAFNLAQKSLAALVACSCSTPSSERAIRSPWPGCWARWPPRLSRTSSPSRWSSAPCRSCAAPRPSRASAPSCCSGRRPRSRTPPWGSSAS